MAFSLTATIRAFVAPDHLLSCASWRWNRILGELDRRGRRRHEAGAFLLGIECDGRKRVLDAVYYDELESRAYDTGVCVLHGDAFAKLWGTCRERCLTVVADVHTHPGAAVQSASDRTNPMVARVGHVAVIVPDFAKRPVSRTQTGVYEYQGDHQWRDRGREDAPKHFYIGLWG